MKNKAIPLTRATYLEHFARAMIKNGLSPEYYFKKVNLPTHKQENPESLIPVKPLWLLANLVAFEAGIPDFGAQVAQLTPWHESKLLLPLISKCVNLEELLQLMCNVISSQTTNARFALEHDESGLWFSYVGSLLMKNNVQMELYRMTGMIQLVQLATGSGWFPEQIELLIQDNDIVKNSRLMRNSCITFSQTRSGFPIHDILLKLPINIEILDTIPPIPQYDINADFVGVIRYLIGIFIHNKDCNIYDISKVTEIPIRTLQRRLNKHDTCFSELHNQAKYSLAKDKLKNSSLTITDISFQLGYSDPSHFNHAFNRWAGMSPSAFRTNTRK